MKLRMASPHLHLHLPASFHRPMRFGRMWRGHELALRLIQIALLVWLGVAGAQFIARGVRMLVEQIAL